MHSVRRWIAETLVSLAFEIAPDRAMRSELREVLYDWARR